MSKAKSVVITVLLALAIAVAAFFAAVSFPINNKVNYLNSIASNIHLGADFTGYAYTTIYPEGVLEAEEYEALATADKETAYEKVGGLYVEKAVHSDIDKLKADVASDADKLKERFGKKGYSSYSVAVEDGVSVKISVPTNFTYASYVGRDDTTRLEDLSLAGSALSTLTAYGELTLRTTDKTISLTDANGKTITYNAEKESRNDRWVDEATVTDDDGSTKKTYTLADGEDNVADYFKSITCTKIGNVARITFRLTNEGREKFKDVTTRAASSTSKKIYFFVGNKQLMPYTCEEVVDSGRFTLQTTDVNAADNLAITMNSAVNDGALSLDYQDLESDDIIASSATGGELAAVLAFVACVLVVLGLCIFLVVKYAKLGAVSSLITVLFALVELYALAILGIQVTFAVIFACMACLALFAISNVIVFREVKRLTLVGKTMQASVKDGYKNMIMTVSDMHIVLVIVAILLATVGVGEVAACGFISVIGVVASYVLYWFNRLMWHVTSSSAKDKFAFAGLKRVVYEDD